MAFTNISKWVTSGEEYVFWAALNGGYPYGTTGTIANGSDAGMGRLTGIVGVNIATPDAPDSATPGDNRVIASFRGNILENIKGTLDINVTELDFEAYVDGRKLYADGVHDTVQLSSTCQDFQPVCFIINSRAKSQEDATLSEKGWDVLEIYNVEVQPKEPARSGTSIATPTRSMSLVLSSVATELTGLAISDTNYGVSRSWGKLYSSPYPVFEHTHIGDGADTTVTLGKTPFENSATAVRLWQNGVEKTYTTDFSVSGATLTFVAAPAAGVKSVIKVLFAPTC